MVAGWERDQEGNFIRAGGQLNIMGDREEGVPEDAHISGDSVDSVDCGPLTQWEKQPRKEGEKLSFSHVLLERLISRSGEMFSSH